jgi:hemin uptake protein HemP
MTNMLQMRTIRTKILPEMKTKDNGPTSPSAPRTPAKPPLVRSSELLGSAGELLIEHEGRLYRLRRTRLGKLILTA